MRGSTVSALSSGVQDGCSFSCKFCVIPLVRGRSRSRGADAVLREVVKRVEQGHREVVLTGINLGCFRDRERGYTLARLVREAGATPGLQRLRLSSIEVNHVSEELVRALRETPTVSRHLHVPLQSGDDRVLSAMGRRYTAATYLRRLEPLADFNLTADVIVGFPTEDEQAFEQTRRVLAAAGVTKVHVFPYSPRPGTATAAEDPVPAAVKKRRGAQLRADSHEACLERWRSKLGATDEVLVDRPGRGYGDDYSPWLVGGSAPVGELVPVRAVDVTEEGSSVPSDCLFCKLYAEGDHVRKADGFVAIADINPRAETHLLVIPERHVETFRDIGEFPADEAQRMLEFVADTARRGRARGLSRGRQRRARWADRRSSTCTGTCSAGEMMGIPG